MTKCLKDKHESSFDNEFKSYVIIRKNPLANTAINETTHEEVASEVSLHDADQKLVSSADASLLTSSCSHSALSKAEKALMVSVVETFEVVLTSYDSTDVEAVSETFKVALTSYNPSVVVS